MGFVEPEGQISGVDGEAPAQRHRWQLGPHYGSCREESHA